jgi:thiamine pyrophosphokinase
VKAIIVADGDVARPLAGREALLAPDADGPPLVIAADGGARKAAQVGLVPELVVGDGDSLGPKDLAALRDRGVEVHLLPPEKDESDTELALREALARGAGEIVILGAFGGRRLDHVLASIALLALPELAGHDVTLRDGTTAVRLVGSAAGPGELSIAGGPGDLVSLFPVDATVEDITTEGLRYPLRGESLTLGPSRGLSNELTGQTARVTIGRGRLLVVHTQGGGDER